MERKAWGQPTPIKAQEIGSFWTCGLALQGISCWSPSNVYSMFLHEQWKRLWISLLAVGKHHEIHDRFDFSRIPHPELKRKICFMSCFTLISFSYLRLGGTLAIVLGMFK